MPPIEVGPLRALGAIETRLARKSGESAGQSVRTEKSEAAVVQSDVLGAGDMPVDAERVKVIRQAVEDGTYPIFPARIADAVIAAGLLLRSGK
jgi:negative regulator of flagellin synthesis FlgM